MLSIIIPTYNEEKEIEVTLQRLRQHLTILPFEVIVSDDASTDRTVARARSIADQALVRTDSAKPNIAATRNRGARVARYHYLVFVDCGVAIPDVNSFFTKILHAFEHDPKLVGLTVNVCVEPSIASRADNFYFRLINLWFRFCTNVLGAGLASGKFQIIKASTFRELGGFNEMFIAGEDIEFFKRLSKIGHTRFESTLTVFHGGRRAHALGWLRLWWLWTINGAGMLFFKRSVSKAWDPIR